MSAAVRRARSRLDRSPEGGYVAVMTALLLTVFIGLSAFAADNRHVTPSRNPQEARPGQPLELP